MASLPRGAHPQPTAGGLRVKSGPVTSTSVVGKTEGVVVIGAGVIGLTTAIRLREAGYEVSVVAKDTPETIMQSQGKEDSPRGTYCSSGSGGLWMPFLLTGEAIERWATATFREYETASEDAGVRFLDGFLLTTTEEPQIPWFGPLTGMKVTHPQEDSRIPSNYASALQFRAPVVQMELYLPYLVQRLQNLGVGLETTDSLNNGQRRDWELDDATAFATQRYGTGAIIVNCTGIGAGKFAAEEMIPGRGITMRVRNPGCNSQGKDLEYFVSEDPTQGILSRDGLLAYAIPQGPDYYTLGGTIFKGDWRESATEEELSGVVQRSCTLLQVDPAKVESVHPWTGLRPMRANGQAKVAVREGQKRIVDNFGHGGSGVTTCWGCADQVVSMLMGIA